MMKNFRRRWPLLLAAVLALCCAVCVWRFFAVSDLLTSQQAARRWKGEGEREFAQLSCFLPPVQNMTLDDVYRFRNDMAQKLKAASFDLEKDTGLYLDAWSTFGTVRVSAGRQSGDVRLVAVGGNFFDFHPLPLVSGSYLTPTDVMDDRVLLDRETAWLLFGANDVAGLSFSLGGVPVVAAGVYTHEKDSFSRHAYGEGMCVYMSYSAYARLFGGEDAAGTVHSDMGNPLSISCYELIMAEPVKGFAYSAVSEKFPFKTAAIVENTYRFEPSRLLKLARNGIERSMRRDAGAYPYWENAARAAEDHAMRWLIAAGITGAFPLALLLYWVIRSAVTGKRRLETEILPETKQRAKELVRSGSRRRWERKHPEEAAAEALSESEQNDNWMLKE